MAKREPVPDPPAEVMDGRSERSRAWLLEQLQRPFARDDRRVREERDAVVLADALMGRMGWEARRSHYYAQEHGLLMMESDTGWVSREGRMMGCGFAGHERLLSVLGIGTRMAERMGWARVGQYRVHCSSVFSPAQRRTIAALGRGEELRQDPSVKRWTPLSAEESLRLGLEGFREHLPYGTHFQFEVLQEGGDLLVELERVRESIDMAAADVMQGVMEIVRSHGGRLRDPLPPAPDPRSEPRSGP